MKNVLVITLMSAVLMGCTSTTSMSLKEKDEVYSKYVADENLSAEDKVSGFKLSGWKSLSDSYLIVTAAHNKDYLIETKSTCFGLNNQSEIKLNRSSDFAISIVGDSISSVDETTGKCFISSIYPITREQRQYLVGIGRTAKSES